MDDNWGNREDEALLPGSKSTEALKSYKVKRDQVLDEQDRGLDALHDVIVRQKNLAQNIQTEVVAHNDIIGDIDNGIERTTNRLVTTTQNVRSVSQRDGVCRYWIAIVLLTIVIVVIVALPGKKWGNHFFML